MNPTENPENPDLCPWLRKASPGGEELGKRETKEEGEASAPPFEPFPTQTKRKTARKKRTSRTGELSAGLLGLSR